MKTLVARARWVLAGQSATSATLQTMFVKMLILSINVATGVITARLLAPEGRGEQAAMAMGPQILAYAMTLGIPAALRYNLKRYPDEESELFSAALVLTAGLSIAATVIGVLIIPQWLNQYSGEVIRFAQLFMVTSPLILVSTVLIAALEANYDFTTANKALYLQPLMTLTILLGLAVSHTLTPFTAVLAYTIPTLPIFFWLLHRLWKHFRPRFHGLGAAYKHLTSYGLRAYGVDLLTTLSGQVDQALVVNQLSPSSMGLYVVSISLSRMLTLFPSSVVTVLLPKTAARPVGEVVGLTERAARIGTAFTLLAALAAMVVVPVPLKILYGSEYMGAVPVFRILAIQMVVGDATWILSQAFMALGRPGILTVLQGIGLGLTIPLMLVLIPAFGLEGAGLALLGATTARFIFVLISYPLILKVRIPNLLITRDDLRYLQQALNLKRKSAT